MKNSGNCPASERSAACPQVIERRVRVQNETGLHLRAAAEIVKLARRFQASITLEYEGAQADAESLMSITCLAAPCGARITMSGIGGEAAQALEAVARLFADGFGENDPVQQTAGLPGRTKTLAARPMR